ncbi:MAG: peptidylprolyl isomerase [Rhodospirillales bacterium]|nr:peptidylprolyl isomerase [Rhodospirillales bacterium]
MPRILALALGFAVAAQVFVAAPAMAADAAKPSEDPVVATVNGSDIRLTDVAQAQQLLPDPYRGYPLHLIFGDLLNMVIDQRIAAQAARDKGLHEDEDLRRTLARIESQLLQRALVEQHVTDAVTEEAMKALYDQKMAEATPGDQVHARHILVDSEAEAKQIIEELEGGADFAETAKTRSTGPSKTKGGDLGFFKEGEMVEEFSKAAFALEVGATTKEPVQTQFGWHVIKVEERKKADVPTFEQSQEQLRAELSQQIAAAFVKELRDNATVERFNIDGSPAEPAAEPAAEATEESVKSN